ncbi:MAG: tetratricopeptide repeat protein [Candidatus Melainabacteria bacterium]|nr:tetratricopeptide repeat protein [Candidatus Melainabacteria bacterium]
MTNTDWLFHSPKDKPHVLCVAVLLALQLYGLNSVAQTSRANQLAANEHLNKGNFYLGRRQFTEALNEYGQALDLDPNNSAARNNIVLTHLNWGAQHFAQKHFDEARKEWETVLDLDPYNRNAKHNISVLEQTLARLGPASPNKQPAKDAGPSATNPGSTTTNKPPASPPSAVIILTPGLRQSQPLADKDSASTESQPSPPESVEPPSQPAQPTSSEPAKSQNQSTSGSLEDQLSAIEMKIYGHTLKDMTVFRRLEKIELDSTGQVKSGTIKERIDLLKQTYGL